MTYNKTNTKGVFQSISESVDGFSKRSISGSYKNQREIAFRSKDKRIPLAILDIYSTVLRASTREGFDVQQVHEVWRTASLEYSVGLITLILGKPFNNLDLRKFYFQLSSFGNMGFERSPSPPMDILQGPGSVAFRTLAHMKNQNQRPVYAWIIDAGEDYLEASWAGFTYALLEHLVMDELVTGALRSKLLARDLGL